MMKLTLLLKLIKCNLCNVTFTFFYIFLINSAWSEESKNHNLIADISKIPFWNLSQGIWVNRGTYLGNDFDFKIKSYNGASKIIVDKDSVKITEYRFYPPGTFDGKRIGLDAPNDVGVEFVSITRGRVVDSIGRVQIHGGPSGLRTYITPVDDYKAIMEVVSVSNEMTVYNSLITFLNDKFRHLMSLSVNVEGELAGSYRAFSYLEGRKVSAEEYLEKAEALRKKYNVKFLVSMDNGRIEVKQY